MRIEKFLQEMQSYLNMCETIEIEPSRDDLAAYAHSIAPIGWKIIVPIPPTNEQLIEAEKHRLRGRRP